MSFKVGDKVIHKDDARIGIIKSLGKNIAEINWNGGNETCVHQKMIKLHNPPLTLQDLAVMHGNQVWVEWDNNNCMKSEWYTVNVGLKKLYLNSRDYISFTDVEICSSFKIYRQKPEQKPTCQWGDWMKDAYMSFIEHRAPTLVIEFDLEENKVNKPMPILMTGMVVERENGQKFLILRNSVHGNIAVGKTGFNSLRLISNPLRPEYKIVRIYEICQQDYLDFDKASLIWELNPPKQMTIPEAAAKLSELLGEDVEIVE